MSEGEKMVSSLEAAQRCMVRVGELVAERPPPASALGLVNLAVAYATVAQAESLEIIARELYLLRNKVVDSGTGI